jgi:hypothetical protein
LIDRLADSAEVNGHGLLVMVQWLPKTNGWRALPLIEQARERGVDLLLLEQSLRRAIDSPEYSERSLFHARTLPGIPTQIGHMSAEGNAFVAAAIETHLAGKI